jgi:hypothetical protein
MPQNTVSTIKVKLKVLLFVNLDRNCKKCFSFQINSVIDTGKSKAARAC